MTREEIMAKVRAATAAAAREMDDRQRSGICGYVDERGKFPCHSPVYGSGGPRSQFFYGDTCCAEHARVVEIEMLADDQRDDSLGRFQP
jgi:hypothetical protein